MHKEFYKHVTGGVASLALDVGQWTLDTRGNIPFKS